MHAFLQFYFILNRLKNSQTQIFFEVDSNHFLFHLQNGTEEFSASTWDTEDNRVYIPLSSFDDNNELMLYFTSSILGIYNVKFYTNDLNSEYHNENLVNGT